MADTPKPAQSELEQLQENTRWKVRHVTFALLTTALGIAAAPFAILGGWLPFGPTVVSLIVGAGSAAIAAPLAFWIARMAVPSDGPAFLGVRDPGVGTRASLGQARDALIDEAGRELRHHTGTGGALERYANACVVLTKSGPLGALFTGLAAAVLGIVAVIPIGPGALFAGPALAAAALADAMRRRLPLQLDPPKPLAGGLEADPSPPPQAKAPRPTGVEILGQLRSSPIYRRQDVAVRPVQGRPPDWSGVGLKRLQARYPLLTDSLLAGIGVRQLTANQADAVARILGADQDPALRGRRDFVFAGWPGSGRTSLCNLLTLAALMHREGAVHCISPESPQRGVSGKTAGEGGHSTRHPVGQLRRWLAGTRFAEKVQESYDAPVPRSRDRRLTWPFTLRDALQAFGLEHEALTGRFDGVDVVVERGGDVPGGEGSLSETSDAGPDRGNEP